MPATEQTWRDLKAMHVVFAVSSFVLFVTTVWMMAHDQEKREWRGYQRKFLETYDAGNLKAGEARLETIDFEADMARAAEDLLKADAEVAARKSEVDQATQDVGKLKGEFDLADRDTKFAKARRDVKRANYDIKVRDNAPEAELKDTFNQYEAQEAIVREKDASLIELRTRLENRQAELDQLTKVHDDAKANLSKLQAQIDKFQKPLSKIEPENSVAWAKRKMMEWPIIDGFNSHLKIYQDWLPGLTINYGGMRDVARFDRCRTCHLGINRVEAGNLPTFPASEVPQPFSTHPHPELYLTDASPHPLTKFGCTVCHEGQGSGTSFTNASHTPNHPGEEHQWKHEHHYASNHFWEYPMLPERFREATCIKCHHDVIELGVNPKFGNSAPKVFEGYNLIREYGCFGCHEINGYDGARSIGPDLRLEPATPEEAEKIANDPNAVAGELRKVGPALRHLASKTSLGWTEHWTRKPSDFRPTTRMPQFFDLAGQQDHKAENLTPVEVASIGSFLTQKSQKIELLAPAEGYQPDAARGKILFSQRGCIACHSHKEFPTADQHFGPELSRVGEKVLRNADGQFSDWLYTWIREPERHHPRTKMPNLFLTTYQEGETTIDPAADIAAWLLQLPEGNAGLKQFPEIPYDREGLLELTRLYLSKVLTPAELAQLEKDGSYTPATKSKIKGDEVEIFNVLKGESLADGLTAVKDGALVHEATLLAYVGRRTISRYGCYGCHDIPEFETARPIGTGLRDWGRKDRSKLALEHIAEFLHHHGEEGDGHAAHGEAHGGHGMSTRERAVTAAAKAATVPPEFDSPEEAERESSVAFYYEQILHGDRAGFLWQKLRQPRSYDYKKIETKGYDERLRMPKFPFSPEEIEAVATFVLGLVAEPPSEKYLYNPTGPAGVRLEGEKLLTKYHCTGCHVIDLPRIRYGADPGSLQATERDPADFDPALHLLTALKPPHAMETGAYRASKTPIELKLSAEPLPNSDKPRFEGRITEILVRKGETVRVGQPIARITAGERRELFRSPVAGRVQALASSVGQDVKPDDLLLTFELPVLEFHGLIASRPSPDDDLDDQEYTFDLWESLKVGHGDDAKLIFPPTKMLVPAKDLVDLRPARGGDFAEWLVESLMAQGGEINRALAWQMSPPPLYQEGIKVQTPWLFKFLKNPHQIRFTTVLRMPRFNMSDKEALALANYFAAVDGAEYPYAPNEARDPRYLATLEKAHPDYLSESWKMLNAPLCIKCHSVGGRDYKAQDPKKDIRGPNLNGVADRLRPDWLQLWLYNPAWITPYTSMPGRQLKSNDKQFPEVFQGDGLTQIIAIRDALMNYHQLMESQGKYLWPEDAPAAEKPPEEKPPAEDKPADEKPAEKPDDKKPADNQPAAAAKEDE